MEEVQEKEPKQNLFQLKMVDWCVLEIIKNLKTVVLIYVLLIVSGLYGGLALSAVEEVQKKEPD